MILLVKINSPCTNRAGHKTLHSDFSSYFFPLEKVALTVSVVIGTEQPALRGVSHQSVLMCVFNSESTSEQRIHAQAVTRGVLGRCFIAAS